MERRKLLIGMGSLAAGSAAAMGTGAFTSVTATRQIDVSVASDANAYLRLEGYGGDNADYVEQNGTSGTLNIDLDEDTPGDGVNPDALTQIDNLFYVGNQGSQEVEVDIDKQGANAGLVGFYANPSGSANNKYDTSTGNTAQLGNTDVAMAPGDHAVVSLEIDTRNSGVSAGDELLDSVTIDADAT